MVRAAVITPLRGAFKRHADWAPEAELAGWAPHSPQASPICSAPQRSEQNARQRLLLEQVGLRAQFEFDFSAVELGSLGRVWVDVSRDVDAFLGGCAGDADHLLG